MTATKEQVTASILEARDDLDKALAELESLPVFEPGAIAFAAHALSNFLTVTSGTVELLAIALKDHPDPEVQQWLRALRSSAETMTHTVNQLMGSSASARPTLKPERVDLVTLARRTTGYYETVAARKRIQIHFEAKDPTPPAQCDRLATASILDNLLSNAVKFSEPGRRVDVRVVAEQEHIVCSVCDQGPGISEADQKRLFEKGARLSARPTGGEPSFGYGLSVARALVEFQGGEIWCESRLGHGACFSFRLPAYREAARVTARA